MNSGPLTGEDGTADVAASEASAAARPPLSAPFLAVQGLSKRFGHTQALRDVHLAADADELLVVLGPTGAGKTTLLRALAGLEQPDAGSILMAGREVTAMAPAERDVALVFQNFSLYPRWTVRRNLEFPLRAPGRRVAEAEIQRRVGWAAELLKISRLLDREASRLSGGEMQRVAIGRAIVRRPRLFLMDEPLTNLDAKLREALRLELVELRRELKTPMVFVTHDQAEALSMADRIVVLSEGRTLQTGTPREIYERPSSPLVALQLGQPAVNLLRVRRVDGHWLALDGTPLMPAESGGQAERLLGIRPENIALVGFGTGSHTAAAHEAVVEIVEYIGPTTTLLCTWAGARIHVVVPRRGMIRPGHRVHLRIDAARAVLFDVGSEPTHRPPRTQPRPLPLSSSSPRLPSKGDSA
ncbi:MAG: ABC transporter ATP-binding protein [Polyangiaceae bacterium]